MLSDPNDRDKTSRRRKFLRSLSFFSRQSSPGFFSNEHYSRDVCYKVAESPVNTVASFALLQLKCLFKRSIRATRSSRSDKAVLVIQVDAPHVPPSIAPFFPSRI